MVSQEKFETSDYRTTFGQQAGRFRRSSGVFTLMNIRSSGSKERTDLRGDLPDGMAGVEAGDLQLVPVDQPPDDRKAAAGVDGMEGLGAFGAGRNDDIVSRRLSNHVFHEGPVQEGHVAGRDEGVLLRGLEEARVDPAERSLSREDVGDDGRILIEIILGEVVTMMTSLKTERKRRTVRSISRSPSTARKALFSPIRLLLPPERMTPVMS